MAKVRLDFVPPYEPDAAKLHIYESALKDGPYAEIEVVTAIGAYPNYFSYYTTSSAVLATDWFSIAWESAGGVVGEQSAPIQGGTTTLVHKVAQRVLERDASLSESIVTQEAEEVIKSVFRVADPYNVAVTAPVKNQLSGLVFLTLARAKIYALIAGGSTDSYTAGLVSQKSGTTGGGDIKTIEWLLAQANKLLGLNLSFVMLLEEIDVTGLNTQTSINYDQSRQAITINFE